MKLFLALLFIIPLTAWSQSCSELEYDLLNIENELLNSQMIECENPNDNPSDINCRTPNHNTETYAEILQKYNKAMAALVLHNGILAITGGVQGGHNSLASITPERVQKASEYLSVLEESLTKAEVLEGAMTPVASQDGFLTSFWYKYDFNADMSEEQFENSYRAACRAKPDETLCAVVASKGFVFRPENEFFKTLYGFAKAEMRSRPASASDPTQYYEAQRAKLKITVVNSNPDFPRSKEYTANEYHEEFFGAPSGKMHKLQAAIRGLENNPNDNKFKTRILNAAKELDTITTTYGVEENSDNPFSVEAELSRNFQKPFADLRIDLTDNLTTDIWKNNLDTNVKRVLADQAVLDKGLEQDVSEFVNKFAPDRCESGQSSIDCFKSMCRIRNPGDACNDSTLSGLGAGDNDSTLNGLGAGDLVVKLNRNNELRSFGEVFQQAQTCYEKVTLKQKEECLREKAELLRPGFAQTTKATLESELEAARAELEKYNRLEPFKSITEEKILAIAALELSEDECLEQDSLVDNTCQTTLGAEALDQGAITLGGDLADVSIRLSRTMVHDAKGYDRVGSQRLNFEQSETTFRENCTDSSRSSATSNLCQFYTDREATRIRMIQQRQDQREESERRAVRMRERTPVNWNSNDRGNFDVVGKGIMQGLTTPNPITGQTAFGSLISGGVGYFQTKDQIKSFRSQIEARSKLYDAQKAYALANRPPYSDVIPYYGGYIHNGHLYDKNFQSTAAAGNLYAPLANPLSFNFQTSLPGTGTPVSTPATPTMNSEPIPFSFGL